jgi:hypothetical protein
MLKKILLIFLFAVPFVLALALPLFVLLASRELAHVGDVVVLQKSRPGTLISFAYNGESDIPYKRALIKERKPNVVVVGNSRVMQIRQEFFVNPAGFANAAVPRGQLGNFQNTHYLVDPLPNGGNGTILFVGLDQVEFYERYPQENNYQEGSTLERLLRLPGINIRRIYLDYLAHKFSVSGLLKKSQASSNVGFAAVYSDNGYRADGSYLGSYDTANRLDVVAGTINDRMAEIARLESALSDYTDNIRNNFSDLDDFLQVCRKRNITVVGFIPPDLTAINKEMSQNDTPYKKMYNKITEDLAGEFKKNGFIFFDLSDIKQFGGKDSEFIADGHGTDLLDAKAFVYMADQNDLLKKVINKDLLIQAITRAKGDFLPF